MNAQFARLYITLILSAISILCGPLEAGAQPNRDLTQISLEDLMNIEFYSAAKKPQKMFDAAAAVYVITPEDIRRSGATSVPELLRMVPGISVQRLNSHAWDISARGFNNSVFANKMLVLIDGRAVYTPLHGGVYWDVQDVVLEDIERIEVIRGPGGALWGANAVNGVINVITKKAQDTQGTLISAGGGSEETGFATLRHGGRSKDWYYRVYSKYFNRAGGYRPTGTANDEWEMERGGFRAEKDKLTIQGDIYEGQVGQRQVIFSLSPPGSVITDKPSFVQGHNLLARYQDEDWSLQGYWDRTDRDFQVLSEERNTLDVEYNHKVPLSSAQEFNWGLGYRLQFEDFSNTATASITSVGAADQIFSLFAQDEILLMEDRLKFLLGSKLEYNIFTKVEVQPNVRASYTINERNMVWTAASRAVRTPSRFEEDGKIVASFTAPSTFSQTVGNHDLASETLHAYELGYRTQPLNNLFVDLAVFHNRYDRLITFIPGQTTSEGGLTFLNYPTVNGLSGDVQGAELAGEIQVREWWKVKTSYTLTKMFLHTDDDIADVGLENTLEHAVPRHILYLRSSFDLPHNFELDAIVRCTDSYTNGRVPSNTDMDISLTKKIHSWEISLVGQNLFRSHRKESVLGTSTQIQRAGYAKVTRRF